VDEKDQNEKVRRDFDLSVPNLPGVEKGGGRDSRRPPARPEFDLTTPNILPHESEPQPERRAPDRDNFDLTIPLINQRRPEGEAGHRYQDTRPLDPLPPVTPPTPLTPGPSRDNTRRVPLWVWLVGGGGVALLMVVVAAAVVYLTWLRRDPVFTLKVTGAPVGSRVYVDNVPLGVTQPDGTIIVAGLKAGETHDVRVKSDGYADYNDPSVEGEGGKEKPLEAKLTPLAPPPPPEAASPGEIDYYGKMVLIPAGSFVMGDNGRRPDEAPAHDVKDVPAFYIDKYEVTNELYKKFCDETGHAVPTNPHFDAEYFQKNPQMPVIGVSYEDASAYARWAGKRLPNEVEWEKAASWDARSASKRPWPWGSAAEQGRANVDSMRPTEVGRYAGGASAYGVQDMAGNVTEWVDAFYQPYEGNRTPSPNYGTKYRVTRGGSFRGKLDDVRTTRRDFADPALQTTPAGVQAKQSSLIGFRCAVSADDPKLKARLEQTKK